MRRALAAALLLAVLPACDAGQGDPRWYRSPEPDLQYMQSVFGRLRAVDGCIVLVTGKAALDRDADIALADAAIPLFVDSLEVESEGGAFAIRTPRGETLRDGDLVNGEGGPWPRPDPRSAPVADAPDLRECPGQPYQIVSLSRGWGSYDPDGLLR